VAVGLRLLTDEACRGITCPPHHEACRGITRISQPPARPPTSQFRSISNELYGTPDYHAAVRQQVVKSMQQHAEEYAPFLGSPAEFLEYLEAMQQDCTWGDELTLVGAALR